MDVKEWPLPPRTASWWLESNTKVFRSDFNGATQVLRSPGSRWKCSLSFSNLDDESSRILEALIASLDGEFGRVQLRNYGRSGRKVAGSPVVSVADQTGTTLLTGGWQASVVVLRIGDNFTVNDELKIVTEDVSSDSSGNALLSFAPMLRSSPPAGAVIEAGNPTGIFKLANNKQGKFQREKRRGVRSALSLEFEEAF